LTFDFQSLFYYHAQRQKLGKKSGQLKGTLYNVIRNPQSNPHKKSKKTGNPETDEEYIERIRSDADLRREHYFKRWQVTFDEVVYSRFVFELRLKLTKFRNWYEGREEHYRNEGSCQGMFACEYLDACAAGDFIGYKRTREMFRELKMEEVTYDGSNKNQS